ncbi:MAG TPA: Ig-like domain-containing protein, partial [Gemmatimonadaceae bacterium]
MRHSLFRTALRRGALSIAAFAVGSCSSATDSIQSDDVASVVVNPSSTSVAIGSQVPLQVTIQGVDGKPVTGVGVVWTVKDEDIASVSSAGVVTGLALGTTQVAANVGGKSGIAAITVQKTPVASVIVRPNHIDAS